MKHVCLLHEVQRSNSNRKKNILKEFHTSKQKTKKPQKTKKYTICKSKYYIKNTKIHKLLGIYVTKKQKEHNPENL